MQTTHGLCILIDPSRVMLPTRACPSISNNERRPESHLQRFPGGPIGLVVILALLVVSACSQVAAWDPYEVLGVRRDASLDQIKKAYRELARRLHPDKSDASGEDDAGRRFIELNRAFEILKDPARRRRYDHNGDVEDAPRQSRGGYQSAYNRASARAEGWSSHNGFRTYTFFSPPHDSFFKRRSITAKQYYGEFLKASKQRPLLVFFYADICPTCYMIESTWVKLIDELAKYNIGSFAISVNRESRLVSELGVSTVPHIACLLDGQLYPYRQSELSLPNLARFIKNALPSNLVPLLKTVAEQDRHVAQASQLNRLSAIIISNEKSLKLRYLLVAYAARQYYKFGFVSTRLCDHSALFKQYNLKINGDSLVLVFNERPDTPVLKLEFQSANNFDASKLIDQLLAWPHLKLPKLSSQQRFDDLCLYARPATSGAQRVAPSLCVILFASSTPSCQAHRDKMLEFLELNRLERDTRVAFSYLDPDKQSVFAQSLLEETLPTTEPVPGGGSGRGEESLLTSVLLLTRHTAHARKAHYQWLSARWDARRPDELDRAKVELHQYVVDYKRGVFEPKHKALLSLLVDEEGPSLFERLYARLCDFATRFGQYLTSRESFSALMILIGCALMTSLFLFKSPVPVQFPAHDVNQDSWRRSSRAEPNHSSKSQSPFAANRSQQGQQQQPRQADYLCADELKILELKAQTYNGMVRLLKPGFRSIILLTDQASKEKLVANFRRAVWPYRRNKTLLFGYLCLDKNLPWYKMLLERILGCEGLNVNKKNCIGTVLSLNGFKKYLRVYHAKHHEIDYYHDRTDNRGTFLGFDDPVGDDDDDDDDSECTTGNSQTDPELGGLSGGGRAAARELLDVTYTADNLLDRLPIWLDKMFDGLTRRYFLDQWPEEIK